MWIRRQEGAITMVGSATVATCVPCRDIEASRAFYVDTLGCSVGGTHPTGGIELETGDGSTILLYESEHAGTAKHTLLSFEVDDLAAEMDELRAKGVTFEDYDLPGLATVAGVATMGDEQAAWFLDPDGNVLCVAHPALVPA